MVSCLLVFIFSGTQCKLCFRQGRIKGGNGGSCSGSPLQGDPPWWHLFVANKILVWKIFVIQKRFRNTTLLLYSYFALSIRGPQHQLISLQVWLSVSFSNRYRIAYEYFRFGSMQINLILLVTFSWSFFWHGYGSLLVHHAYYTNVTKTLLHAC